MIGVLILVSLLFVPLMNAVNAQTIEGPGGVFDQASDNNANVSFLPGGGKMTFSTDNATAGSEKALNNTIGNTTEFMKPNFDPSKPIQEYDSNSSDWNTIHPFPEGRSD
ncbi:hypothetical protein BH23THE1_BH23THE1_14950 [soil metagenome]